MDRGRASSAPLTRRAMLMMFATASTLGIGAVAQAADEPFFMPITDAFMISGVGMVATGKVERGSIKSGDKVELVGSGMPVPVTIALTDNAGKPLASATAGQEVSAVVRGADAKAVARGSALVLPGSLKSHRLVTAEVSLAATGGRSTPVFNDYRPLLRIWTASVSARFKIANQLAPGQMATIEIELETAAPLRAGDAFDITEGGRTVGTGVVKATRD